MKERYKNRIELLQGTLDFMILQALRWGPQHGYGISTVIRTNSHEAFQVPTGSLYPALHRLERNGWVTSSWEMAKDKKSRIQILPADGGREKAIGRGRIEMESTGDGDCENDASRGGKLTWETGAKIETKNLSGNCATIWNWMLKRKWIAD